MKEQQIMKKASVYVGLDYHMESIQVCVVEEGGRMLLNRRCGNDAAEVVAAVGGCGGVVRRVAVEACCGSADLAEELASGAGWTVSLAHPGYVSRMKHNPDKTDFSDARMLAELCRAGFLAEVWLAPESIRQLRTLVRYRQQLVRERAKVKVRMTALLRERRIAEPEDSRWTRAYVAWLKGCDALGEHARWVMDRHLAKLAFLNEELRAAERRLREATEGDAVVARLMALTGVGKVTAWTLRAEVGSFERFRTGKQLSRFCGLTPRNVSSGERTADAGLIKAGNPELKAVLIQAAHRLMRRDERWKTMADNLAARGKPHCVIVAAVANRWMRWLFHRMTGQAAAAAATGVSATASAAAAA